MLLPAVRCIVPKNLALTATNLLMLLLVRLFIIDDRSSSANTKIIV
jgi:hypothetical protein